MQRHLLVLTADKVVDDVAAGRVAAPVAEPLLTLDAEDDGGRVVDTTVTTTTGSRAKQHSN